MTTIKRHTLFLTLSLLAFSMNALAQTPSIEVSTESEQVEFSTQGATRKVQVEVYAPSGELVFETSDSDGQSIRWTMVNQKGERVADGVYLATITVVDAAGKKRKRIEQVTVSSPQYNVQAASAPTADAPVTTTVNGTAGKLAKFTGASTVGNSVVTEAAGGKVGINTVAAPVATLQVNGLQPAALANTGTPAPALLQTSGGLGGNTTVGGGKVAGAGASISLVAGNGGSAPAGSTRGKGGNITLQPGSTGAGAGTAGASGNVLLAPSGVGNVGVGTSAPLSRLHVVSAAGALPPRLEATGTTSFAAGWDFYHGTVGKGYVGVPGTGVGAPGPGEMLLYGGTGVNTSLWAGGNRAVTILYDGRMLVGAWTGNPLRSVKVAVYSDNSFGAVAGFSSGSGSGVSGSSGSTSGASSAAGIRGSNTSGGWAGYFNGPVAITGGCQGCTTGASDRALKANITLVNPRAVLDRLAALPVSEWNYKRDEPSVRHVGPMAQDFRAAFQLGRDDKHIDMIDANGVTMASVQALYQMMLEKDEQVRQMMLEKDRRIEALARKVEQQQAQLNRVSRAVRRKRASK